MTEYTVKTSDFLNVFITSSCEDKSIERRFHKGITIADLKGKLEILTGGNPGTMKIKAFDKTDKLICNLDNDEALLGSYHIDDGMRIHVEDNFELRKQLDYDMDVQKFELSQEDYAKRTDSLQSYLKMHRLGKYNETEVEKKEREKKREEELEQEKLKDIKVGLRCQVSTPMQPVRRATVKYVGTTEFNSGFWVGVQFDEPYGKNDGSVQGKRYFECPPKYGSFVKPMYIEVGDFPEEEINFDDEL
ncbi:tubulin-folding cofactor B-like [Cimex lectularius]|uniref:CAP-Gly domain-containing protein n=1 Tax=Cimex lectularius TaxID=79782 RepID=A0A8I6RB35_CIMLE|nr:tubulin-folding cofactor B-like [Cimex lectularius]